MRGLKAGFFVRPRAYRFAFEGLPYNRPVHDSIFSQTAARYNSALRDFVGVHYTDNVIVPGANTLHIVQELLRQVFFHVRAEERRMERKDMFEEMDEKHFSSKRRRRR